MLIFGSRHTPNPYLRKFWLQKIAYKNYWIFLKRFTNTSKIFFSISKTPEKTLSIENTPRFWFKRIGKFWFQKIWFFGHFPITSNFICCKIDKFGLKTTFLGKNENDARLEGGTLFVQKKGGKKSCRGLFHNSII